MAIRIIYEEREDIIVVTLSDKKLWYEEEIDDLIVGFSEDNEPVWLEILDVNKRFIPEIMSKISESIAEAQAT